MYVPTHTVWSSHAVDLTVAQQSMDYDIPGGKPNRYPSIAYLVTILKDRASAESGSSRSVRRKREGAEARARAEPERLEALPQARGRLPQRSVALELGDLAAMSFGCCSIECDHPFFKHDVGLRQWEWAPVPNDGLVRNLRMHVYVVSNKGTRPPCATSMRPS